MIGDIEIRKEVTREGQVFRVTYGMRKRWWKQEHDTPMNWDTAEKAILQLIAEIKEGNQPERRDALLEIK